MLRNRTIKINTSDAPQAILCQSSYGLSAYLNINKGKDSTDFKGFMLKKGFPKAVKSNGAVSPKTLDIERSIPVNMPPNAEGKRTFKRVLV